MDDRGAPSFSRGRPRGATLEWPTALQSQKLAEARAATAAKEAAYREALRAALEKTLVAVAALAPAERGSFLEASIKADTQAYYPLDSGYAGDFSSLYQEPQARGRGAPVEGEKNPFDGMSHTQAIAFLQKQILADVRAGKPAPMIGVPDRAGSQTAGVNANGGQTGAVIAMAGDLAAMKADPGLPRLASREVDWALEQLVASGYIDDRLGSTARVSERQLKRWLHADGLQLTESGLGDGKNGFLSNVTFVPGHKGQGIQLHDSVFAADKSVGMFERTQPYALDFC